MLEGEKYIQKNDHWSFWAKRDRGHKDNNYHYHFTCLYDIISHYKSVLTNGLTRVIQVSDGCGDQYKSKFVVNMLTETCDRAGIDEIIFSFMRLGEEKVLLMP